MKRAGKLKLTLVLMMCGITGLMHGCVGMAPPPPLRICPEFPEPSPAVKSLLDDLRTPGLLIPAYRAEYLDWLGRLVDLRDKLAVCAAD